MTDRIRCGESGRGDADALSFSPWRESVHLRPQRRHRGTCQRCTREEL
jgi:hypothetical protein